MVHRGAAVQMGDPIYMIETIYAGHSKFKIFPSEQGFRRGLKAVTDEIAHMQRFSAAGYHVGGAVQYKTYILPSPQWQEI